MANENFSGKGHSSHICKKCSKLTLEERNDQQTINRIYSFYQFPYLSKTNKAMLIKYCNYKSEKVRVAAKKVLDDFIIAIKEMKAAEELELEHFHNGFSDDDIEEDGIGDNYNWEEGLGYDDEIPF
jgi:hypothetical protein